MKSYARIARGFARRRTFKRRGYAKSAESSRRRGVVLKRGRRKRRQRRRVASSTSRIFRHSRRSRRSRSRFWRWRTRGESSRGWWTPPRRNREVTNRRRRRRRTPTKHRRNRSGGSSVLPSRARRGDSRRARIAQTKLATPLKKRGRGLHSRVARMLRVASTRRTRWRTGKEASGSRRRRRFGALTWRLRGFRASR